MTEIICAIITGACGIIMTAATAVFTKDRKRTDMRALRREQESQLSMKLMSATLDLAFVTSLAVTGGHTNGNVEAAQKKAKAAQEEYDDFLRETAAHAVSK